MLNIAAPEKYVLTLQSIPPFLIESILAFALAVLLAVPLIARLRFLFDNCDSHVKLTDPINIPGKRLHRQNRHILQYPPSMAITSCSSQSLQLNSIRINNSFADLKQSLETLTSVPFTDQSQDQAEDDTEEEGEDKNKNDDDKMSNDNLIMNIPAYEYKYYRHKLIKENLKKQYGHFQAPGNFVLNSIHLNSIDSQKAMKTNEKYNHTLPNFIESIDVNGGKCDNEQLERINLRDYFLTKESREKMQTIDKGTETLRPTVEIIELPEVTDIKESLIQPSTQTRTHQKHRSHRSKEEKSSNDNGISDNVNRHKTELVEINSRPNTPRKVGRKSLNRPRTPRNQPRPKKPLESDVLTGLNSVQSDETMRKPLNAPEQIHGEIDGSKNSSYSVEVSAHEAVEKNEKVPLYVSSMTGKSSIESSEVFSTCSSRNLERRPTNTRPGSSSGGRVYRNLMSKINSRPRSSDATYDWDMPNVPSNVTSHEKRIQNKIISSNAKRPRSANTPVNRKKSEVLSVLESIMDLTYEATMDFQESTIDIDIKNFREMSDNVGLKKRTANSVYRQIDDNPNIFSTSSKKTKLPVLLSNQKRSKPSGKPITDNKEPKEFLRARSGTHRSRINTGQNKHKSHNQ